MFRFIILLTTFAFSALLYAEVPQRLDLTLDDVAYIYDGDTFYIQCQPGLVCDGWKIGIRPPNVDTPEIKGKCQAEKQLAQQAKQFTVSLLRRSKQIILTPLADRPYDKYGRLLAYVVIDGSDLGESLIEAGLGRPYGNGRRSWCTGRE